MHDLPESALDLAALLRQREVSSVEVTRHFLDVIARKNAEIAAFVEVRRKRALADAGRADRVLARRAAAPAFLGVPTGIKDSDPLRGSFVRVGSRAFRWVLSPVDGHVARTCRRGGFVFLGKTATSELTILPFVHGGLHPPTRNPHAPDRYAGGSSGGAAAAVASGMLPIAPGSDGAGSIRIPSSFCGLVGVKPSRGALVHAYAAYDRAAISTQGPIAKNVADAAALLDVLAGGGDAYLTATRHTPRRLRIRVLKQTPLTTVDPEISACVDRAARHLEDLGHAIDEGGPIDGAIEDFLPLMTSIVASIPLLPFSTRWMEPTTLWMRSLGRAVTAASARDSKARLERRVLDWLGDADAWITPTVALLPPKVGSFHQTDGEAIFRAAAPLGAFTAPFNVSGQPAISVPAGVSKTGAPIGVQLVGKVGADRQLLGLARALEEALAGAAVTRRAAAS